MVRQDPTIFDVQIRFSEAQKNVFTRGFPLLQEIDVCLLDLARPSIRACSGVGMTQQPGTIAAERKTRNKRHLRAGHPGNILENFL